MLSLAAWEPLSSVSSLRAQSAFVDNQPGQVSHGFSAHKLNPRSLNAIHASAQPNTPQASPSSADLTQDSLVASTQHLLSQDIPRSAPDGQLASVAAAVGVSHLQDDPCPDAFQLLTQKSQEAALEDGELLDADTEFSEPCIAAAGIADETATDQEQHQAAEGGVPKAAKRKRGERAGKRVRQRQAKRARELEQEQLHGGPQEMLHAPKVAPSCKKVKPTCKYFLFGKCSKGETCPFPHVGAPVTKYISCRFFQQGNCGKGENCQYSHNNALEPCKQLVLHGICRFGPSCHFSHDSLPEYAVVPLKKWFREQDQLKLDRSARLAEDLQGSEAQDVTDQHQLQTAAGSTEYCDQDRYPTEHDGLQQQTGAEEQALTPSASSPSLQSTSEQDCGSAGSRQANAGSGLQQCYRHWTDGWQKLYANRLEHVRKRTQEELQKGSGDIAALSPLEGPYSTWKDGWNRLFSTESHQKAQ